MSTYTSGPWHEKGDDGMSIVSSNGRFVAGCQNVFADPQENADNARLIAAAPDLLQALSVILGGSGGAKLVLEGAVTLNDVRLARAAIDKATGAA